MTYKFFRLEEFNCTHTNRNEMDHEFLLKLDELREKVGFPFRITSGYRDATHPAEARKAEPGTGTHCQGIAADIAVSNGFERMNIVHEAIKMGFSIGVARTFVHVDNRKTTPVMWTYS
jgi:zinc D-Ala-D-Ala carboxypeptidase